MRVGHRVKLKAAPSERGVILRENEGCAQRWHVEFERGYRGDCSSEELVSDMRSVELVREFHMAFGQPFDEVPSVMSLSDWDTADLNAMARQLRARSKMALDNAENSTSPGGKLISLRVHLALEELAEMCEAVLDGDLTGVLDALTDRQYVLDGDYLAFGLDGVKVAATDEVHRSNMSKLVDGKPVLSDAGRVLKPDTYSPAELSGIVEEAIKERST